MLYRSASMYGIAPQKTKAIARDVPDKVGRAQKSRCSAQGRSNPKTQTSLTRSVEAQNRNVAHRVGPCCCQPNIWILITKPFLQIAQHGSSHFLSPPPETQKRDVVHKVGPCCFLRYIRLTTAKIYFQNSLLSSCYFLSAPPEAQK